MKEIDIKALEFRDELIKLCKKYNCDIGGTCDDSGNINFTIDNKLYDVKSFNYIIREDRWYDELNECKLIYILDEYIKNCLPDTRREMQGLNNVKIRGGIIFTNNNFKANDKFKEILNKYNKEDISKVIYSKKNIKEIRLKDGTRFVWVVPSENARGYRCNKAYIDRNVSLEQIRNVILPIMYCGKDDVEMF